MQAFVDCRGRKWAITFNVGAQIRIKSLTGIDIFTLWDGDAKGLSEVIQDRPVLCNIVFHVVRDEKGNPPISEVDFFEAMDGDTIELMADAFTEELIFYSPSHTRKLRREILAKTRTVMDLAMTQATTKLEKVDPAKMLAEMISHGNGSSGNSPAASASTPENGRSDNSPGPPSPMTAASGSA